ncbi:MAG: hypothetical protein L0Z62_02640 [Gemmataceae bacterium]|nr:hypothetical protein [Gemmataceae bacterium]
MRQLTTNCRVLFACLLLTALVAGCSTSSIGPEVKGKVTFHNKPLTTGLVIVHPDSSKGNLSRRTARGIVDGEGKFTLSPDGGGRGVPPGWYKVCVVATKKNPRNEYAVPIPIIPPRFADPKTSGQAFEVKEGGAYDIKLR